MIVKRSSSSSASLTIGSIKSRTGLRRFSTALWRLPLSSPFAALNAESLRNAPSEAIVAKS